MRAVRQARPEPFGELLCLLRRWREGPQAGAAARCDGVLLHGRLGCGKSTTARALCAELGLPLGVASAAAGEQLPRRALERAVGPQPSVLLLERLELLAPAAGGADRATALLPWLRRARESGSVFVIGCCCRVEAVHPRVRRWFDDECELPPPSSSAHRRLLLALLRDGSPSPAEGPDRRAAERLAAEVEPLCTARAYVLADDVALVKEARLMAAAAPADGGSGRADEAAGLTLPSLRDFRQALAQRVSSGLAGVGGVIDAPDGTSASEHSRPSGDDAGHTERRSVSWDDIGGLDGAKARMEELLVWPYSRAAELRAMGITRPAVGLLLHGPPGTGKTMLAKACAHQVRASFVALELSAVVGAHVGESERLLSSVFAAARRAAPSILFLDELDALFVGRDSAAGGAGTDRLTTTLATELDRNADELAAQLVPTAGAESAQEGLRGVFVIAATNNASRIDPCLRAAGRLEAALSVGYPGHAARQHIAQKLLSGGLASMVEPDVTAELIAQLTEPHANSMIPCSGADIKAILGQAVASAVHRAPEGAAPQVTAQEVRDAVTRLGNRNT